MSSTNFLRKITARGCGLSKRELNDAVRDVQPGEKIPVMQIAGTVVNKEAVDSDIGTSTRFIGDFAAVNILTGEKYRSDQLFVPGIGEMILEAMTEEIEGSVEFAIQIGIEPNTSGKGGTDYQFTAENLLGAPQQSAGEKLLEKFAAKAIAAPKKAAKK